MDIVCLRNISINTLHKGDDDDNGDNNNNKFHVITLLEASRYLTPVWSVVMLPSVN